MEFSGIFDRAPAHTRCHARRVWRPCAQLRPAPVQQLAVGQFALPSDPMDMDKFVAAKVTKNGDPNSKGTGTDKVTLSLFQCTGGKMRNLCLLVRHGRLRWVEGREPDRRHLHSVPVCECYGQRRGTRSPTTASAARPCGSRALSALRRSLHENPVFAATGMNEGTPL
ncbi:hypothetical protein B0H19DRAFT_1251995 [Mycena capillaripes]|nr:hypothetical protein B0H19DRAFT_1251995 [Mycena capillaripes]